MSVPMQNSSFRVGGMRLRLMILPRVVALHGLKGTHLGALKETGSTRDQGVRAEVSFEFTEDDPDVETVFRSAFGGYRSYYWSFINEENPQWRSSTNNSSNYGRSWTWQYKSNNYGRSWSWQHRVDEDYDSFNGYEDSDANLVSHRLALGLQASGPLKLEDVKNAYRACAMKWHPDRHQGSSKVMAEEKFKVCSVAYQSLCDKLAVN
uniref:J domain-containing protein n=1 Tax=Cucumis melo TaxID=3656 RepID=A0A9I9CWG9_CUCME